ncbi:MMPL/RND family transporter [Candidatus Mycolicibacterium alkanivorans]|uniref:RND family transporter n=1 Tax=Candidatus Mycolicibacterium alkanivorans TaxID=2954114 RepID=A0ABS9Z088_9MYCO|nr:RND family transporter [Candidatus Mycolicibacterium alkanivorans]MCI4676875.1 RND family transporter [Candidatus Mycolicibacterium alkanivorans]
MSKRAIFKGVSADRFFHGLGRIIVRHPLLVIAAWIALAGALFILIRPLAVVAAEKTPDFLPKNAPVLVTGQEMQKAFKEADTGNFSAIILSNENGLTPADEATYRNLVDKLRADTKNVTSLQDFVRIPELREVMTSKDQKAWNLPVSLAGTMGTPSGQEAYRNFAKTVKDATAGSSLQVNVVGGAATFEDLNEVGVKDQHLIEAVTVVMVFGILIIVYRSLVAMIMPLITIGVSLVVAQQLVAGLGELGLGVGSQTIVLMTGMMMGAGIDYAVFLYSRYQELLKTGMASDDALVEALVSIGEVIAGSAGTVALTFLGMSFTKLAIFSTVGPVLAVTITVGFLAAITLLPALIVLAGRRGWVKQRKDLTRRMWRRSGIQIVRRPALYLVTSVIILGALAACTALTKFNYDDRKNLPPDSESNRSYQVMDKHFPISSTLQQFLFIQSPNDLRSPKALADMEQMAARVAQLPNIDMVRGLTRPTGQMLEQAKATYQAGEVGTKLGEASDLIATNDDKLSQLTGGADKMADVLNQIRNQLVGSIVSVRGLASALDDMSRKYGGATTLNQLDKTAALLGSMRSLGDALGLNVARISDVTDWATPLVNALNQSPQCDADPECVASRSDLQRIVDSSNTPAMAAIADIGRQLQATNGTEKLDDLVKTLGQNIQKATTAARSLGVGEPGGVEKKINDAVQGANLLADSSRQLAMGVQLLVDQTRNLGNGLDQASAFLLAMKREAADPPMSGFYIPPQILSQDEFKKAAKLFISEDGHSARYLVQTALNPFSTQAMDQVTAIVDTANSARPNTMLDGATISMVGLSSINADVRSYYNGDIRYIMIMTLVVVFLILVVLLRALVAPLYLVVSVVLSYGAALGIGVVVFQLILKQELSWGVPGMAFMVLVAVGADYNLLLISRIRDEAKYGVRSAVIRTVGATGGVITSAGLIFAASMLAITVSSILTAVQMGFVIGVGLLLDTFIVRTLTVPAMAVLVGEANWWPSQPPRVKYQEAKLAARAAAAAEGSVAPLESDTDTDTDELAPLTPDAAESGPLAAGLRIGLAPRGIRRGLPGTPQL